MSLSERLLAWYDHHRRDLPWRHLPTQEIDPYRVWLSEIMLQQTTVKAVIPYFLRFIDRWPRVEDLAAASWEEVSAAWAGLGYYSRARNLLACARRVVEHHHGRFPRDDIALRALPGIGPYTAGAIGAIAFGQRVAAVDGNVERVISRLCCLPDRNVRERVLALTPAQRTGDFVQALMDLGATVCTPRAPRCLLCPWREACCAFASGTPEHWPVAKIRVAKPLRYGWAFVIRRSEDQALLLRRRPETGLLGGMADVPGSAWTESVISFEEAVDVVPAGGVYHPLEGVDVRHIFTHFTLTLRIAHGTAPHDLPLPEGMWWHEGPVASAGLPSVARKVVAAGGGT